MKILFWNIRGLGNAESRLILKKLCNQHKPHLVCIAEPWIEFSSVSPSFWKSLGLKSFLFNDRNNRIPSIWCLCSDSINPSSISVSVQHCSFSVVWGNQKICLSAVYASTTYLGRKQLGHELSTLSINHPGTWIYFGDFNAVLGDS